MGPWRCHSYSSTKSLQLPMKSLVVSDLRRVDTHNAKEFGTVHIDIELVE